MLQKERVHFIHMTDTHITADPSDLVHGQDTYANYLRVLEAVAALDIEPAFFVLTGDLSNHGEPKSYERLLELVERTEQFGAPVLLGLGNHDSRSTFQEVVLGRTAPNEDEPYYYSTIIDGVRAIMLDSKIPGEVHGAIDEAQLQWLAQELDRPDQVIGTIVCFHHPPHISGAKWLDDHGLRQPGALRAAIEGRNVLGMLHGHTHYFNMASFGDTMCATGAGVAHLLDPSTQDGLRFLGGAGFNLVSILDGTMVVHPVTLPGDQPEIRYVDGEAMANAMAARRAARQ